MRRRPGPLLFVVCALSGAVGLGAAGCATPPRGCTDGIQDGDESGPDCGGSCPSCGYGDTCRSGGDCASARCEGGRCAAPPACGDGILDGTESDVDCGGACGGCPIGGRCGGARDCGSGVCELGRCRGAPTCTDGQKNASETDVDCGGGCPPCRSGAACAVPADCRTGRCEGGTCRADPCNNGVRDGDESDVDCGGAACPQCPDGASCGGDSDCRGGHCMAGRCVSMSDGCPAGYTLSAQRTCVCDPAGCGSCCDVDEGNVCGLAMKFDGNNCGSHGQSCFRCNIGAKLACQVGAQGDYCALACEAAACGGCCSGLGEQNLHFCLHGDEDTACGKDGVSCVICPLGKRCVGGACVAPGGTDGGA